MKICICGGGSLGHVCIGVLSSHADVEVVLYTRRPEKWQSEIEITDCHQKVYPGKVSRISSCPQEVIPGADLVFFCLPGFMIEDTLREIQPYLSPATMVGTIVSSTGFFFFAHEILGPQTPLFGFQRVPFIARVSDYGKKANLLGYKSQVAIAVENHEAPADFRALIERLFLTPTVLLNNFYEASLTNSNPILHTGRLYSLWHRWNGETRPSCGLFYREWDEASAQMIIDMDQEFMQLLDKLGIASIPTLLDYYESTDAKSLARKLSTIPAFYNILSPMKETPEGWVPDFGSRYFTEDFPFGLRIIKELAVKNQLATPTIDKVYEWGMSVIKS